MMKKIIVTGATLLMALFIAAPSFAIETKVTGTFTLDGVLNLNPGLESDDADKETVSYREMQLRINTETKINDKITFFTRFDILDKILSSQYTNTVAAEDDDNIQFDHAWMRIISPIGLFQLGRKTGVKWGTDFFDDGNAYGTDRAEYIVPINIGEDKFVIGAVAEKALETQQTNRDNDKFYLTGTYVNKEWKSGLLVGYYSYNSFKQDNLGEYTDASDMRAAFIDAYTAILMGGGTVPAATAAGGAAFAAEAKKYTPRMDGAVYYIAPYFSGKLGPLNINAEFGYIQGEVNIHPDSELMAYIAATPGAGPALAAGLQNKYAKKDAKAMCYWLEVGYPVDKANIEAGYAFMSGDKDGSDGDLKNAGLLGQGKDWEKLLILTGDNTIMDTTLGDFGISSQDQTLSGNILNTTSFMNTAGMNLMYLGGSYNITDSVSIGGIFGMAKADKARVGWDDDYGMEMDLKLGIKFMDNLEYNAVAAYLKAGDFWKGGTNKEIDDVTSLYHELVLSF